MQKARPRLLFLTSRFPYPLEKGDKLRAYHFIRTLSRHFDIGLFAINDCEPDARQIKQLATYCTEIKTAVIPAFKSILQITTAGKIPFQTAWFYNKKSMEQLEEFSTAFRPDYLFCHLLRMAEYARRLNIRPNMIDYMDAFSTGMERMAQNGSLPMRLPATIEAKRLKRYEHEIFSLFDHRIIISGQDRDCIPHSERSSIHVIPNGVDMDYFRAVEQRVDPEFELMFNGNMAYPPNIASAVFTAKEIMPLLKKEQPGIRLLIAGPDPVAKVKALGDENITVSGWMNDIRQAYTKSKIMIAPMLISIGLQNKILQAMAMKVPCIVSTMANNALGAVPGEHLLIADTPKEWQQAILLLLHDEALCHNLTSAAHKFVQDHFNWQSNAGKIAALLTS